MANKIYQENYFFRAILPPERAFPVGFPVKEIGYLDSVKVSKELTYDQFVEFSIRLSSQQEEKAVDVMDGRRYETAYPHILIKKPGVHHAYTTPFPRKTFYLEYSVETFHQMEAAGFCFEPLIWPITLTDTLQDLIRKLTDLAPLLSLPLMRERADALGWLLILELLEKRHHSNNFSENYRKIQDIAVYLQTHCLEITDISEVARKNGFSSRSFLRHWRNCFELSPLQMINQAKLEYACHCLRYTDMSIGEIAHALNVSMIYFERLFRKKLHMTPRQYRLTSK